MTASRHLSRHTLNNKGKCLDDTSVARIIAEPSPQNMNCTCISMKICILPCQKNEHHRCFVVESKLASNHMRLLKQWPSLLWLLEDKHAATVCQPFKFLNAGVGHLEASTKKLGLD